MNPRVTFLDISELGLIVGTAFTTIVAAYATLRLVDRITIGKRTTRLIWLGAGSLATGLCAVYYVHMAAMQFMTSGTAARESGYLTFPSSLALALLIVLAAFSLTIILISVTRWRRTPPIQDFVQGATQLQSIFDNVSDGVAIFDMRRNVLYSNRASAELLGPLGDCASADMFEASFDFTLPNGTPLVKEEWPIALALRGEFVQHFEVMIRRRDSDKTICTDMSTAPIKNRKGQTVQIFSVYRDITHPILDLGALAHDFNNLLGVITGNLSLVERWVADNAPAMKHLEIAELATIRSADLMGRLLAFPGDPESRRFPAVPTASSRQLESGRSVDAPLSHSENRMSVDILGRNKAVPHSKTIYEFAKQTDVVEHLHHELDAAVVVASPRVNDVSKSAPARDKEYPASRHRNKVLVVDDEPDLLEVAVAHLENMGYTALSATGAANALEIARQNADIALIVTDVIMPGGMDGVELAQKIRYLLPFVKVIYSSGFSADALADRNRTFVDGFLLQKPYLRTEFDAVIRRAMDETKSNALNFSR